MEDLIRFLTINRFTHTNDIKHNFTNAKCHITILEDSNEIKGLYQYYCVQTPKEEVYSENLEIYWLIGYLTYYGYMDKDYKKDNYSQFNIL